jgi:long-chain acyl-CoA synthetase
VPNLPLLEARAREFGCELEVSRDLVRSESIRRFMAERVAKAMEAVSNPERVKAFLLLGRPLTIESEELTATQKVRRRHVVREFEHEFEALYAAPQGRCTADD